MTKKVLLVTADSSLLRELGGALRAQQDLSVMEYPDEDGGLKQVESFRPDFVIVSLALATNPTSPVTDLGGLEFCKGAINVSSSPIALVTPWPVPEDVIDKLGALGRNVYCDPVKEGYVAKVLDQIRTTRPPPKHLNIFIKADADNRWSYDLVGENFQPKFERPGTLSLDKGAQFLAKRLAAEIEKMPSDWEAKFTELGEGIVESLFGKDSPFVKELKEGVREAGGLRNTRLIFTVDREYYEIALEAVLSPGDNAVRPWMIRAPVVRNFGERVASNTPLFDGPPRLKRCLIVGADTSGFCDDIVVDGSSIELEKLSHVESECAAVEALFKKSKREMGFDDPKVVGIDPSKPLTKDDFLDLLTEPWDVIHFAGHAYYSPAGSNGGATQHACLFVGESKRPQAVEMNTIVPSLRETTSLLYLSGCRTANAEFAIAAAQYGVPAVLGFRWKVQDKPAEQHARLFYHQLFRERAIDKAFRNTRRGMRLLARKDNAWASGMLVMAKSN